MISNAHNRPHYISDLVESLSLYLIDVMHTNKHSIQQILDCQASISSLTSVIPHCNTKTNYSVLSDSLLSPVLYYKEDEHSNTSSCMTVELLPSPGAWSEAYAADKDTVFILELLKPYHLMNIMCDMTRFMVCVATKTVTASHLARMSM